MQHISLWLAWAQKNCHDLTSPTQRESELKGTYSLFKNSAPFQTGCFERNHLWGGALRDDTKNGQTILVPCSLTLIKLVAYA